MPDLITHVAASHLIRRGVEFSRRRPIPLHFCTLFYLGTILPDILTRPFYILFPATHDWTIAFHTPVGMLFTTGFLAMFFGRDRRNIFIALFTGAMGHFIVDTLQKKVTGNDFWLFPFSWKSVGWGVVWADDLIPYIPIWIGIILLIEMGQYLQNRYSFIQKRH